MGTISITLPINAKGNFRIRDKKTAKRLVEQLEQIGERVSPIDELFGIWADRPEKETELTKKLRDQNNRRNA